MEYHFFCDFTLENIARLNVMWFTPDLSKYQGKLYIASFLDKDYAIIARHQFNDLQGLVMTENKISAEEESYKTWLMNVQYRLSRFTKRFYELKI